MLIPHEDKVDVITPINILFIGGGECWSLMKIKLMSLPQPPYIFQGGWRLLIPHEDKVDVITPVNIFFRGGVVTFDPSWCYYPNQHIVQRGWQISMWWWSWCDDVMMVMMMMMMMMMMPMMMIIIMIMIMTIVSVEQRPGWGEHILYFCLTRIWCFICWCTSVNIMSFELGNGDGAMGVEKYSP